MSRILALLRVRRWAPDATLIAVSEPDKHGFCTVLAQGTLTKSVPVRRAFIVLSVHVGGSTCRFMSWTNEQDARSDFDRRCAWGV
jgi:hypothetical protein